MALTDVKEKPLFSMTSHGRKGELEGSVREDEMLYGTYIHGVLDKPAFRKRFLAKIKSRGEVPASESMSIEDYNDFVDMNLDKLADAFESGMDMDAFIRIVEGKA